MQKLFVWCKHYWLLAAVVFLLAFIPLYPKLPLLDIVQTWVYIRLEDFVVALVVAVYILSRVRKRVFPDTALTIPIFIYWVVGLLSLVNSLLFIGPKLMTFVPHLAFLHYLRRIEYMVVFFCGYQIAKDKPKTLPFIIWTVGLTAFIVFLYGIGQKFLGFPAFLTMNEEFAKGVPLRLPPTARIASTFAGHYDLAAYLVLVIPLLGSMVFGQEKVWQKAVFFVLSVLSFILLLFTASRISFGVYLIAITLMLLWHKKRMLVIPVIVASIILLQFMSGASERFNKTFRYSDVIVDLSTGQPVGTLKSVEGGRTIVERQESPAEESLPKGTAYIGLPDQTGGKSGRATKTVIEFLGRELASGSGEIATISGSFLIQKALVYDMSFTTRFQGEWPQAIAAFKRNVLLGSGYSTLSLATDGDYVRMLGETGLLGAIAFIGILIAAYDFFGRGRERLFGLEKAYVIGLFAGLSGLCVNAVLIDVFEASKVAFVMWILLGIGIALLDLKKPKMMSYGRLLWKVFSHKASLVVYLVLFVWLVYGSVLHMFFVGEDFTWLRWAAQTHVGDIAGYFTDARGFFYRPIPKLWYFVLYSFFWLKPGAYHASSLILYIGIAVVLYFVLLRVKVARFIAWVSSALFGALAVHHENVFWISAQSSLLAGFFFACALLGFIVSWSSTKRQWLLWLGSALLLFVSMISYDGMLIGPVIVFMLSFLYAKKKGRQIVILLLVPLVWWMHTYAQALTPSGTYGYNPHALLFNVSANSVGYLVSSFFGQSFTEYWEYLRSVLRYSRLLVLCLSVLLASLGTLVLLRFRQALWSMRTMLLWFLAAEVSILAYMGLGGMAERYALMYSFLCIVALALLWDRIQKRGRSWMRILMVIVITGLFVWNISGVQKASHEWKEAGSVVEGSLLTIKKAHFPLQFPTTFVFVNTPIRYGRAWVFSVGLRDPLWHMFKFNQYPFDVTEASTPEEAYEKNVSGGGIYRFIFDDYKLKNLVKEAKEIPIPE